MDVSGLTKVQDAKDPGILQAVTAAASGPSPADEKSKVHSHYPGIKKKKMKCAKNSLGRQIRQVELNQTGQVQELIQLAYVSHK